MVDGISGFVLGIICGIFLGIVISGDLQRDRLENCLKLNMTLADCAAVHGWEK